MLLGRFKDAGEHAGRSILLDDNALAVEGHGSIPFTTVAEADARGEVEWDRYSYRTWMLKRAAEDGWTAPASAEPADEEAPVRVAVTAEAPKAAEAPKPRTVTAPKPPVAAAPAAASTPESKAQAKRAAKEAKAAERAAYEAASQARIAAAAAEKAAKREAKAAAKAEAKRSARANTGQKAATKAETTKRAARADVGQATAAKAEPAVKTQPAPSAEKHSREGRTMLSPGAKVALGVMATLLLAAAVALGLGKPMTRQELPTVKVETPAETAGTTASD